MLPHQPLLDRHIDTQQEDTTREELNCTMRGNLLRSVSKRLLGDRQREIKVKHDTIKVFENTNPEDILVDFPSVGHDDESGASSDVDDDGFLGWGEQNSPVGSISPGVSLNRGAASPGTDKDALRRKSSDHGMVVVETETAVSCIGAWGGRGICISICSSMEDERDWEKDDCSEHSTEEEDNTSNHVRDPAKFDQGNSSNHMQNADDFERPSNWVGDDESSHSEAFVKPSNWVDDDESSDSDSEDDDAYRERMMAQARRRNSTIETQTEEPCNYEKDEDTHERQTMRQTRRLSMPAFSSTALKEENPFVGAFFSPTSDNVSLNQTLVLNQVPVPAVQPLDQPMEKRETRRPLRRASVSHSSYKPTPAHEPEAVAAPSIQRQRMSRRNSTGAGPGSSFTSKNLPQNSGNDPFAGGFDSAKVDPAGHQPPRQRAARRPSLMQTTYDFEKIKTHESVGRKPMRRRASMNTYQPNKEYEDGLKAFGAKSHQINQIYR